MLEGRGGFAFICASFITEGQGGGGSTDWLSSLIIKVWIGFVENFLIPDFEYLIIQWWWRGLYC